MFWLLIGMFMLPSISMAQKKKNQVELSNKADSISYALGADIGNNLKRTEMDINADMIYQGLKDAIENNGDSKLTDQQAQALLQAFQQEVQQAQIKKREEKAKLAKTEGELFLKENKEREGVMETESGLQYMVLRAGDGGAKPAATNTVKVHYEGKLLNEKVFDSSYQRGEPIEFPLNRVIKGWTEGLQLMDKGAKYRFFIPSELAYGAQGAGQDIGPNETLIFEVELLDFQ